MSNDNFEIERKYLIERPAAELLASLPESDVTDIVQIYLKDNGSGMYRRIRKRGTAERGYRYYLTEKKDIGFGKRIELEREIAEEEYSGLLPEADPDRIPIVKQRCTFVYDGQFFELDVYEMCSRWATLEIELDDINEEVRLPETLKIIRDVTGDRRFGNMSLSKYGFDDLI